MEQMDSRSVRVACETLGCKVNQAEMENLSRRLSEAGFQLVSPDEPYDIYILNTCTVTHIADRKSRHLLRMAKRNNPNALIVATGCYSERDGAGVREMGGVDLIIGNGEKSRLPFILQDSRSIKLTQPPARPDTSGFRTRAFVKIQDGCVNFCAYCIVPYVRVNETSMPEDDVIAAVRQRAAEGYKEVVLTGVKVGTYKHKNTTIRGIIERVLNETDLPRIRLSSLQPQEISPEFIELWKNPRLCRHFHLALQSGCDKTLKAMRRRYTVAQYKDAVNLIRSVVPGAAITTDIIVGFPGETDADFEQSCETCKEIGFARIHAFPYSPRRGTLAAALPEQVDTLVKKSRMQTMLAIADQSAHNFHAKFIGQTMPVLWEQREKARWSGLTDNYIKVYVRSTAELTNLIIPAKLVELVDDGVQGELAEMPEHA